MKNFCSILLFVLIVVSSCGEKSGHDHHGHDSDLGENEQLYQDVLRVHDEAMAKMNDTERIKTSLTEEIANNPDMPEAEKQARQAMISKLDSANEGMMAWMRTFDPPTDSSEEFLKTYLEKEMVRVKEVHQNILSALEEAEKIQ